jgi:hypothetical protein
MGLPNTPQGIITVDGGTWLPIEDAAGIVRTSPPNLLRWIREGRGPPITMIGKRSYISQASLAKWLRAQEVAS